jgi:hypothetical protein
LLLQLQQTHWAVCIQYEHVQTLDVVVTFEVLAAVLLKIHILWDMMLWWKSGSRHSEGSLCLHFQKSRSPVFRTTRPITKHHIFFKHCSLCPKNEIRVGRLGYLKYIFTCVKIICNWPVCTRSVWYKFAFTVIWIVQ